MPDDWSQFPEVQSPDTKPLSLLSPPVMATIPQMPLRMPVPVPVPTAQDEWSKFPVATPTQTPAVTTGPATAPLDSSTSPTLGTYRAMSFGPGNFPGADKATNAVMYGALMDPATGKGVKMGTSDIAMSPNVMQKHGLKLGDYVDVMDQNGKVVYPHQRIADKSYVKAGVPTFDSIELWGRPDIGSAQIRRSY